MQQKTIYQRFLLTGISIFILLISCNKSDGTIPSITNYNYKNLTSQSVRVTVFNVSDEVMYDATLLPAAEVFVTFREPSAPGPGISFPFPGYKRILLRFIQSNTCLENFTKITDPRLYDNFSPSMYTQTNNILIYNIDQEELDAATPCP